MPIRSANWLSHTFLATLIVGAQISCGGGGAGPDAPLMPESTQAVDVVPVVPAPVRLYSEFQARVGSRQCEAKSSVPALQRLNTAVAQLEAVGIEVVAASCGNTGFFYPAICGGATGHLFLVSVKPALASDLMPFGFTPTPADRPKPIVLDCALAGF